jgi:hypothetical protein
MKCQEVRVVRVVCSAKTVVERGSAQEDDVWAIKQPVNILKGVFSFIRVGKDDSVDTPVRKVG